METPFFSILVPVYNVKKYLDACLETLTSQSFDDYEVVLVDDGSTDGSGAMCDSWQARCPDRVRVCHQPNTGVMLTRARLFREARGKVFVCVDSDDTLRQDALEILYPYFADSEIDMVVFRLSLKKDYSVSVRQSPFPEGQVVNIAENPKLRHLFGATFQLNGLSMKAFRRELVELDRDYSSVAHIGEGDDLVISLPLVDRAKRIVFINEILYYYRTNPVSISNTYKPKLFRSVRDTLRIQRTYAEKWDGTGALAVECDRNALRKFYDVIVGICLSGYPLREKRQYLLEVVTDGDFARCLAQLERVEDKKTRLTLALANRRWFAPLFLYGALRRAGLLPAGQED